MKKALKKLEDKSKRKSKKAEKFSKLVSGKF